MSFHELSYLDVTKISTFEDLRISLDNSDFVRRRIHVEIVVYTKRSSATLMLNLSLEVIDLCHPARLVYR